jgi:hypothetical protein
VTLVALSSGVNVPQIYTITKLHQRQPKVALAWALILDSLLTSVPYCTVCAGPNQLL